MAARRVMLRLLLRVSPPAIRNWPKSLVTFKSALAVTPSSRLLELLVKNKALPALEVTVPPMMRPPLTVT